MTGRLKEFKFIFRLKQVNTTWGELSSEWGELSSECWASCLGVSFLWGEFSLGRVVFGASCPDPIERYLDISVVAISHVTSTDSREYSPVSPIVVRSWFGARVVVGGNVVVVVGACVVGGVVGGLVAAAVVVGGVVAGGVVVAV